MKSRYFKDGLILFTILLLALILPKEPIDPWKIFSLSKIASIIFALVFIQALGSIAINIFGTRLGAILTGFFGGLISSTATTASLARQSVKSDKAINSSEILIFLSATLAMLFEGIVILLMSSKQIHPVLFFIFVGPTCAIAVLILFQSKKIKNTSVEIENKGIKILPILKLATFIVAILALSKILQSFFGESGLITLTFLVSLFEIHGSVIANIQMHDNGAIGVPLLGSLLATSIASSFISKLFLVYTIGSPKLKTQVLKYSLFTLFTLIASWIFFIFNVR